MKKKQLVYLKFKRPLDVLFALIVGVLLAPVFVLIALIIKLDSQGPVLFKQNRIGKNQVHFRMVKFRTMRVETPSNTPTHQLNDPLNWLTRVGRFLRKTSLDELPQVWNILKGEMSFVGPRPALWNQDDLVFEREKYQVHDVLPGITGWAQVYGRDELTIADKAKLDGAYITHLSFFTDLKLILRTVKVVLKSEGVMEGGTGSIHRDDQS